MLSATTLVVCPAIRSRILPSHIQNCLCDTAMGTLQPEILCTILDVTKVEPLEKTAHVESIDPTNADMGHLDCYVPMLFVYRLEGNSDAAYLQAVNGIKEGLQKVLVAFFPWAGRWVAIPGGMQRQLLCNDKGVPFIEAFVDKDMDSVVKVSAEFQPVPELQGWDIVGLNKVSSTIQVHMQPDGLPCAFLQLTRFKCGGIVVAVTIAHMLADGSSICNFMAAWSDFSRTNKTDRKMDHNRGSVQASTPTPLPSAGVATAPGKVKVYEVCALVIESLKREVKERGDGAYVTTHDCIYAHLWKTVSSLPFSINGGKEICMLSAVEGRSRFYDHPVPHLLGNIVMAITPPKISTTDLLNRPLSLIASKIREKMKITASEHSWLSPIHETEIAAIFMNDEIIPWMLTNWSGVPIYSIDFGFGKPLFVTAMNTDCIGGLSQGVVMVSPPTPGVFSSAACVTLWLKNPQLVEALESHPDFLPFFLPQVKLKSRM